MDWKEGMLTKNGDRVVTALRHLVQVGRVDRVCLGDVTVSVGDRVTLTGTVTDEHGHVRTIAVDGSVDTLLAKIGDDDEPDMSDPVTRYLMGDDDLLRELRGEGGDGLHPTGRCWCAGEGRCLWCQRTTALVELEEARLEIRRLRAAEAPGTDDEVFEGTGWSSLIGGLEWLYEAGTRAVIVKRADHPTKDWAWESWEKGVRTATDGLALDTMRAAVPGSV